MRSVALVPAVALLTGVCGGIAWAGTTAYGGAAAASLCAAAAGAWASGAARLAIAATVSGYLLAGVHLGAHAAREALRPPLRALLDERFGGFALSSPGPPGVHDPISIRARLAEDAARGDSGVTVRAALEAITLDGRVRTVPGRVRLTIGGPAAEERAGEWRAGRAIEVPVTFRRPARYLNDGVRDFERDQALDGVVLAAAAKSGLLVSVVSRGTAVEELAAAARAAVRRTIARHVAGPLEAGIVTAILIGDRTGLPDEIRQRLQKAGTYHVIAISGGNIAILAALMAGVLLVAGVTGRPAALGIMAALLAYSAVADAGPSVWRATATAVAYLAARLLDHRSPPWNAMAVSAAVLACAAPLDVRDVGFALSFGATAAILEAARWLRGVRPAAAAWAAGVVAASFASEIVLLPIAASAFARVTAAGLVLNLVAVPAMTVVQIAGLAVVCLAALPPLASAAGLVAGVAATALVESARLVDLFPWLAVRVPPPSAALVIAYYAALGSTLLLPSRRGAAACAAAVCGIALVLGLAPADWRPGDPARLRLTMMDVGQGESLLVEIPGAAPLLLDAGGAGFDGGAFDIGGRVLAPALWARGVRRLQALAITHGDPDHIGGAPAVVQDFGPAELWEGIPVPGHAPSRHLRHAAVRSGARVVPRFAGARLNRGAAAIRVLHPPPPDWQRPRVRNDDSLVLEVVHGHVAFLLTGDAGADVERAILPHLTPARIRVLKAGHHGSRTSTSQALIDGWRPHIALVSCGRGNRFGHPAPEVLERLEAAGVRVHRTDRDGQITVETDGDAIWVATKVMKDTLATKDTKSTK